MEPAKSSSLLACDAVRYVWHHATQVAQYAEQGPIFLVKGKGARVWDDQNREYIDAISIIGVTQVGHGRAEIAEAMAHQARKLAFASLANGFSNEPATQVAKKLAQITPGELEVSFFACSGSEAVDTAIKMARQYFWNRGERTRTHIIGRSGSYHGITFGALSAGGISALRIPFEPLAPTFAHVSQPYCYRCEFDAEYPSCSLLCARSLEQQILFLGPERVAAFIAEPIALFGQVKIPPPEYWVEIQSICQKYGVLLIVDEVFNGFGRTGRMFACEHFSITPDILVVSKGLTSGYAPLSAAIATRRVADAFWGDASLQFLHAGTYSGHPVSCAAALANIEIIESENLPARAAKLGKKLLDDLRALANLKFVGHVSGIGLLLSIELVTNKSTKSPPPSGLGTFLKNRMADFGVMGRNLGNSMYFYPPLVISEADCEQIVAATKTALADASDRFS